jgi:hypothetical protein
MQEQAPRCWNCRAPGTLLCDALIGLRITSYDKQRRPRTRMNAEHFTCDRPLCESCASSPRVFVCGGTDWQPLDFCPLHCLAWEQEWSIPLLTEANALGLRARLHDTPPLTRLRLVRPTGA